MGIDKIKKLEQAVVKFLNFDGWNLEWTGDGFKHYDACGFTRKGVACVIEMKFRNKYYEEKMLEKSKYNALMKINKEVVKLYFVNDPKGNFLYWLNTIKLPEPKICIALIQHYGLKEGCSNLFICLKKIKPLK